MPEFPLTFTASVGANTKPAAPEHRATAVADAVAMNTEAFMMYYKEDGESAGQRTGWLRSLWRFAPCWKYFENISINPSFD